nr:MAG TPA: hypothetical protein [Caudoviricetes sp.]
MRMCVTMYLADIVAQQCDENVLLSPIAKKEKRMQRTGMSASIPIAHVQVQRGKRLRKHIRQLCNPTKKRIVCYLSAK